MRSFLQTLAHDLYRNYQEKVGELWIVFPNRRAGLFFKKHLSSLTQSPLWAPEVYSIEDLVYELADRLLPDRLTLVFELYQIYKEYSPLNESFDRFYFWGEILLEDFSELDKWGVDAAKLFMNLKDQKGVEAAFAGMDEDDAAVIRSFWSSFSADRLSVQKERFMQLWEALPDIYKAFNERLASRGQAYEGALFRLAAEKVAQPEYQPGARKVIFAGFNALNRCESRIISTLVERQQAEVFWDADAYYVDHRMHEAGYFLRQHRHHPVLQQTFPKKLLQRFADKASKVIHMVGVPLEVGQAKALGHFMAQHYADASGKPLDESETVVVVPDETLLFPVLHSLPEAVQKLNVTMGYPLRNTPLFSLVAHLIDLQETAMVQGEISLFHHQHVLHLLRHPYIFYHNPELAADNVADIEKHNRIYLSLQHLKNADPLYDALFRKMQTAEDAFVYLLEILVHVVAGLKRTGHHELEEEYFFQFVTQLKRLREVLTARSVRVHLETFWKLFKQLLEGLRMPFAGEPLEGLQVMGALETRNLDFKNVFVLSMNEGTMPPKQVTNSFIPYNLRRAFGLTTPDQRDSMYAYYFYRLLHEAENVYLFYNTETTSSLSGEMSRWLYQLKLESGFEVREYVLTSELRPLPPRPLQIRKTDAVQQMLRRFLVEDGRPEKRLTPSAINTYLECPMQFYFRFVTELRETDEVETELSAATFGSLLHSTMEHLYQSLVVEKGRTRVEVADFVWMQNRLEEKITEAFREYLHVEEGKQVQFEGRNIIAKEIIKKYAKRVLEVDEAYAPFDILGLEANVRDGFRHDLPICINGKEAKVGLKGVIDRIDRKDGQVRVLDYKTGRDDPRFATVEELFDGTYPKRNKAALQTLFYGMLYHESRERHGGDEPVAVGLYNAREMFEDQFNWTLQQKIDDRKTVPVHDIGPLLPRYREELRRTLEELFDPAQPFVQTTDLNRCQFCRFAAVCHRD
ncbi:PD-(D/E)XK nuclease superfamily protein [Catalinimonas alkaloidigena]|uniref:PD-(D/E)XK nuclease superfamily protein n=1 Tax=Catalinimonas alkaloidigena TaxID=1075417 RepID=A0A1G8XZQ9_9BACT|nr:PD-(D/E)XK nuclease family protein [Catalinimonas alkaloidigena]SDJ96069.1 PD-(D/E)XK nuclease superfamily protein [Catalinimonas alkaloidigena]